MRSLLRVGITTIILAPGSVTHQTLAMRTKSAQGWRPSPSRPNPRLWRESKAITASKGRVEEESRYLDNLVGGRTRI